MSKLKGTLVVAIIFSSLFLLTLSGTMFSQEDNTEFSGQNAYDHIEHLIEFGPRTTGSAESIAAGDYILGYLENLGWVTSDDWHTLDFGDSRLVPARNLIASYGDGPAVIIGGHYDTRVFVDQDADPNLRQDRAIGANDNGSGNGVILEIARVISEYYIPQQEIRLVFFDAEDNPGISPWRPIMGSTLYVERLGDGINDIQSVIILDMVGDQNQFIPVEVNSQRSAPQIVDSIWSVAHNLGYDAFITRDIGQVTTNYNFVDDHIPFIDAGVPAVLLIDFDYPYWHTTQDTLDKISIESLERVGDTLITYLVTEGIIIPKELSE